jgi:hypothetical protein
MDQFSGGGSKPYYGQVKNVALCVVGTLAETVLVVSVRKIPPYVIFSSTRVCEPVQASFAARGVNRKGEPLRLGRPPVNTPTERDIRKLRAKGMGILNIAKTLGIGTSVVQTDQP